jgi:serine/threonine protein kinase/tetratricopeptide (TPR) repeat protein
MLDDYLVAVERGTPISPDELLELHPEDAPYLRGYLSGLKLFHAAAIGGAPAGSSPSKTLGAQSPGRTVGDYRLLREIGRGGMGVVYEAEQMSLRRRVALKVLPFAAGHDPKQIGRFKNEAQAAAQVQHPNIVPVFAIGEDNGVHYYAMQLIAGQSLANMIEELRPIALRSPSGTTAPNNTLTLCSGEVATRPCIESGPIALSGDATMSAADTGDHIRAVARLGRDAAEALHAAHEYGIVHRDVKPSNLLVDDHGKLWITDFGLARCREDVGLTQTGAILGTVRYMSPEQTTGRNAQIDHHTDVYSLGVTLYELATLHHPADGIGDAQLFLQRDWASCKPVRHWNRHIPRDFQTIVMKAIAESPQERYATARELAEDLDRFLKGEPIQACPLSLVARAGKWAKRHRGTVLAGVVVLIVAFAGLVANMFLLAGEKAETERALAVAQQDLRLSQSVLDRFAMRLDDQLVAIPGAEGVRHQLLEDSLDLYADLAERHSSDPALYADLAAAYGKIGSLAERMGNKEDALQKHMRARDIWQQHAAQDPSRTEYVRNLAQCDNNIGLLLASLGRPGEARQSLEKAERTYDRLLAADPDADDLAAETATTYSNLGLVLGQTGATDDAAHKYRAAISIQERLAKTSPDNEAVLRSLAASYNNLAEASGGDEAAKTYQNALAIQRRLVANHPINRIYQGDLARTYNNLGFLLSRRNDWNQAELCYTDAIRIQEHLVATSPLAASYRRDLAISYNNLGMVLSKQLRFVDAGAAFQKALGLQQFLAKAQPDDGQTLSNLGGVYNNLGMLYDRQGQHAEAEREYRRAIRDQQQALDIAPASESIRGLLGKHYVNLARNLCKQNRPVDAVEVALERKRLWPDQPERLYSVVQELAAAYQQMTSFPGTDPSVQRHCVEQAVITLQDALALGLPKSRLTDQSISALSGEAPFRKLLATP